MEVLQQRAFAQPMALVAGSPCALLCAARLDSLPTIGPGFFEMNLGTAAFKRGLLE